MAKICSTYPNNSIVYLTTFRRKAGVLLKSIAEVAANCPPILFVPIDSRSHPNLQRRQRMNLMRARIQAYFTLLARSLAPPIMSLGFVPRGFFRLAPVRCRFCLLQFAYFNLLSTHSALHFDHLLHKIYFTSVRYTIHHLMSRCRPLTSPAIFQCLLFSPTTAALLDSTLPTDHPHPSTPYHVIV